VQAATLAWLLQEQVGSYPSGKSFLLEQLLQQTSETGSSLVIFEPLAAVELLFCLLQLLIPHDDVAIHPLHA
jgi:hypothetical protein